MAAKDIPGKVGEAELKGLVKRILEDEQLRGNLASAYGAARSAFRSATLMFEALPMLLLVFIS